jgi:RNA recognition motif-containing protein
VADALKTLFTRFGEVESVKVIKDRFSGRSKRFGFIEMPSSLESDQAIKALNENRVDGDILLSGPRTRAAKNDVRNDPFEEGVIVSKQRIKKEQGI